jgi:outer membrane protein assembly factor BamB
MTGMAAPLTGFRDDGAGRYPDATPVLTWGPASNVLWKTALPDWSNASPILVGKRIFVCAEPATMIGLDATTGAILWQDTLDPLPPEAPKTHPANGYTSPTPCSDGKRIWAVFGQGLVACWDVSGKRVWSVTLEKPPHDWGGCISPRLVKDRLIVQFDHGFGLDARTGAVQWKVKTEWGWGSPVVARIGKAETLFTCKGAVLDPATGQELARDLVKLAYNSPALVDGVVYYLQQKPQAYALPATTTEAPRPLWKDAQIAGDRYYATPLVHDGLVYAINQARQLSVLDRQTGALVYEQRVGHLKGIVYPSPTLGGKHVFLSSEDGQTVVIEAGRTYRVVAENTLESFRSCPVFAGRRMYIRGLKHLWCIGEKGS